MKSIFVTANETYLQSKIDCIDLLKQLKVKLRKHAKKQKNNPANWGYAGDINEVKRQLIQLTKQLQ